MSKVIMKRIETIDRLIRLKATGPPTNLALRLSISVRSLHDHIDFMKSLGAPIIYCRLRCTYYYSEPGCFEFSFKKDV